MRLILEIWRYLAGTKVVLRMPQKNMGKCMTWINKNSLLWRHNGAMASQVTSFTIVYSIAHSGTDRRKRQSSVSLAFARGIHRWPVNSPHKGPVTQKMFPFDDVIMCITWINKNSHYNHTPIKLPWAFPEAPLIFNGASGNIQGNLDITKDNTTMFHGIYCISHIARIQGSVSI